MKLFFCFLLCFCLNFRVWAQDISLTKGLAIGDVVPSSAGLDAYRGRLLILDFWATWCAPCRAMIPRTDSLNQAFERQLLILPVTYETEKLAGPVLYRLHRKGMAFPEVFRDTVLRKLFPHVSLPHYVWIDPNGVVRAITEAPVITAANIRLALSLGQYPRGQKNDLRIAYDPARPLFAGGNGGDGGQLRYHSMLAGYVPGLPPALGGRSLVPVMSHCCGFSAWHFMKRIAGLPLPGSVTSHAILRPCDLPAPEAFMSNGSPPVRGTVMNCSYRPHSPGKPFR
jgi:thiol-disulfide isomerase/thioredoxin